MKRRKWRAALTALLLLAAVGGLLWCFFPRSMMEGELYCVTLWDEMCIRDRRNQADKDSRAKNDELLAMEREVSILEQRKVAAAMEEKQLLDKLWETYELSHEAAKQHRVEIESVPRCV